MLTHDDLVRIAIRHLRGTRRCEIVFANRGAWERPDVIAWAPIRGGTMRTVLVECKTSLTDFYADRRKPWRKTDAMGMGRERWYLAPKGIVCPEKLSHHWGLLEVHGTRAHVAKRAIPFPNWNRDAESRLLMAEVETWQRIALYAWPDRDPALLPVSERYRCLREAESPDALFSALEGEQKEAGGE